MKKLLTLLAVVFGFSIGNAQTDTLSSYCGFSNPLSDIIGSPVEFCGDMSGASQDGLIYAVGVLDLPTTPQRDLHTINGVLDLVTFQFYGSMTNKGITITQNEAMIFYKYINGIKCQFGFDGKDTTAIVGGFQFGDSHIHIYAGSIYDNTDDSIMIETPDTTIVIK